MGNKYLFTLFYISINKLGGNICPPGPHIDQYIWTRIFVHILKNILGEKTFVHLVLALVGHVLAVVEGAVDRGAAVKEVADL